MNEVAVINSISPEAIRVIKILKKAKKYIKTENTFAQFCWAKDANNNDVLPQDLTACRWSLVGAIAAQFNETQMRYFNETWRTNEFNVIRFLLDHNSQKLFPDKKSFHDVNNEMGFDAVHNLIKYTIKNLKDTTNEIYQ